MDTKRKVHPISILLHILNEWSTYDSRWTGRTTFVNASIKPWPPLENGADVRDPIVFDYFVNL
jgi:hypothetical protein